MRADKFPASRPAGAYVIALVMLCGHPSGVGAGPVVDALDIQSGGVSLSSTAIDFTTVASSGIFAGLSGTAASTSDLSFAAPAAANFIALAGLPTASIASVSLDPGVFTAALCGAAPAPGQTCTPTGSRLNLINTSTGVLASFTMQGTIQTSAASVPITGIYTFQLAGSNYQSVLATLGSGGTVSTSYSADFSSAQDRITIGGSLTLSTAGIDFSSSATVGVATLGGIAETFTVAHTSSGSFAPLAGTSGIAKDLLFVSTPVNTPVDVLDFLTLIVSPTFPGDLTFIPSTMFGSGQCFAAPAPGQVCGLPGSAFTFANVSGGSIAMFDVLGDFGDAATAEPDLGLFSLQFTGLNYQTVLAQLVQGQSVPSLYSASFAGSPNATVPEPATLALLAVGLAGLGFSRRKQ